jgi:hypothetical protein
VSGLDLGRLRRGELIAGVSAVLLLVFMFLLSWYAVNGTLSQTLTNLGGSTSFDGWNGLGWVKYLVLLTVLVALAVVYFQAAGAAPALPVALGVIATVLGVLSVLALIGKVLIDPPGSGSGLDVQLGAYLGLVAAVTLTYGCFRSLHGEAGAELRLDELETVRLGRS